MTEKQRLINDLLEYKFKCEAGTLKNCIPFKDLKRIIDEEARDAQKAQGRMVDLKLERPLCVIDLETTGTDVDKDRIVEVSVFRLDVDGTQETWTRRVNPGIPIPPSATAAHGITDADVKDAPSFVAISKELFLLVDGCDIVGFNSNRFDVPILFFSFDRVGIVWNWQAVHLIDVSNIFRIKESRTLSAAVEFYLGKKHDAAHSAEGDVKETFNILLAQLARYEDIPRSFAALALFSNYDKKIIDMAGKFEYNKDGEVIFTFGPHKGIPAKKEKGFLTWMLSKDFTKDTKRVVNDLLLQP